MKERHWFRPKRYGWGFVPVTLEGWIATFVLILVILLSGWINGILEEGTTTNGGIRFLLDILVFASIATFFFEKKMKEPLQWRWGKKR
jgi:hypothetical protein